MISVVTVNFNAGPLLARSVRAALASTEPVEVIVVDNGSTDGSVEALRGALGGDPRVRILSQGRNTGFAAACNTGMRESRGELVLLLNPDCIVGADTLATVRAALNAAPEAGMAGCLLLNEDGTEQEGCRRSVPTPGRAFVRAFGLARLRRRAGAMGGDFVLSDQPLPAAPVEVDAISGAFMMVRREALDAVGPLDEAYFMHCEDLDWCMRFRQSGRRGAVRAHRVRGTPQGHQQPRAAGARVVAHAPRDGALLPEVLPPRVPGAVHVAGGGGRGRALLRAGLDRPGRECAAADLCPLTGRVGIDEKCGWSRRRSSCTSPLRAR